MSSNGSAKERFFRSCATGDLDAIKTDLFYNVSPFSQDKVHCSSRSRRLRKTVESCGLMASSSPRVDPSIPHLKKATLHSSKNNRCNMMSCTLDSWSINTL